MLNPVLRREIQTSLSNWKVYAAILFYVACLVAVAVVGFWSEIYNSYDFSFSPGTINELYAVMAIMQLVLIIIIVPAITGGSINGERERQTFDLMLVSRMKPFSIVAGKLLAGIAVVILMIIASAPVFAITIQFGGASVKDVLLLMLYFMFSAVCLGSVSILFSALIKKSAVSMVLVYVLAGVLTFGTLVVFILYADYHWMMAGDYPPVWIYKLVMAANPLASVTAVIDSQINIGLADIFSLSYSFGRDVSYSNIWGGHIIFMLLLSVVSLTLAAKVIDPVRNKRSKKHRQ
ncbi:MAG: ABC transporter permease [Firmicutes bacterium]|nr:ABC transporter permease [Bacillota bacterium]